MYKWIGSKIEPHRSKFRVAVMTLDGKRRKLCFETTEAAEAFMRKASTRKLIGGGHPTQTLIDEYLASRTDLKKSTIDTLRFRLAVITKDRTKVPIEVFPWAKAWSEHVAGQSADSQLGIRSALQGFLPWAMKAGILRKMPELPGVVGRRNRGKEQLRIDEAKKVVARALADEDPLALAVVTMMLTGIRPGEAMALLVRDLDDGATVLWVAAEGGKTAASRRMVEVVPELSGLLAQLAADRPGSGYLFPFASKKKNRANTLKSRTDALKRRLERLCDDAKVPLVVPHSLRGFHSTVATERGATGRAVADALGHTSFERITARHYLAPGTRQRAEAKRVQRVLVPSSARTESGELPSKFSSPQGPETESQQPPSQKNSRDYN